MNIQDMSIKKFSLKVAWFLFFQALILVFLCAMYNPLPRYAYMAATLDKHERIARVPPPRVILVGGSNLALGIRSEILEKGIGKPVVNMGLSAGLGLDFLLNEVRDYVGMGDIIVLSLEYEQFRDTPNTSVLFQLLQFRPESARYVRPDMLVKAILYESHLFVGEIVRFNVKMFEGKDCFPVDPLLRPGFDKWGDLTLHWGLPPINPRPEQPLAPINQSQLKGAIRKIEQFAIFCEGRGARVYYSFPCFPKASLKQFGDQISAIESAIKTCPHLVVIDSPLDYAYDWSLFYEPSYHPTLQGATIRTLTLEKHFLAAMRN